MTEIVRETHLAVSPQHHGTVPRDEFDERAQMCNECIGEALGEMDTVLARRGLVASAEEQESND